MTLISSRDIFVVKKEPNYHEKKTKKSKEVISWKRKFLVSVSIAKNIIDSETFARNGYLSWILALWSNIIQEENRKQHHHDTNTCDSPFPHFFAHDTRIDDTAYESKGREEIEYCFDFLWKSEINLCDIESKINHSNKKQRENATNQSDISVRWLWCKFCKSIEHMSFWDKEFCRVGMAERGGFEPPIPYDIHAFQACALGHYATSPENGADNGTRTHNSRHGKAVL